MSETPANITVQVFQTKKHGLPNMSDLSNTGRVAFIFDGCVVSGWPVPGTKLWEPNSDVGRSRNYMGVTHWLLFPEPVWDIELTP